MDYESKLSREEITDAKGVNLITIGTEIQYIPDLTSKGIEAEYRKRGRERFNGQIEMLGGSVGVFLFGLSDVFILSTLGYGIKEYGINPSTYQSIAGSGSLLLGSVFSTWASWIVMRSGGRIVEIADSKLKALKELRTLPITVPNEPQKANTKPATT